MLCDSSEHEEPGRGFSDLKASQMFSAISEDARKIFHILASRTVQNSETRPPSDCHSESTGQLVRFILFELGKISGAVAKMPQASKPNNSSSVGKDSNQAVNQGSNSDQMSSSSSKTVEDDKIGTISPRGKCLENELFEKPGEDLPDEKALEIANKCGLPVVQVKAWFRNRLVKDGEADVVVKKGRGRPEKKVSQPIKEAAKQKTQNSRVKKGKRRGRKKKNSRRKGWQKKNSQPKQEQMQITVKQEN